MVPEIVSAMTFHLNQAFDGTAKSTDKIYKEKNPQQTHKKLNNADNPA